MAVINVRVQNETFDLAEETDKLVAGLEDVGALVSFVGLCRSDGGRLAALELEHYPGMAEQEITRIAEAAAERWPVQAIGAVHRSGRILPGEGIVAVVTASEHRAAAFSAAEYLMDFLKTNAPFWKKEHLVDGSSGDWVAAKSSDDEAAGRWKRGSERPS